MPNRTTPLTTPTLGRGQGARPGAAPVSRDGERTLVGALSVPIEQFAPDPAQPRRTMDDAGLRDLAASLKEYGVLQPLLVHEDGTLDDGRTRYMIVAGGRRYAAAVLAGLVHLPVVVKDTDGADLRITQLIENVQRQDLAPLEEARAFQELMDAEGLSAEALGARLHISGQKVRDRLLVLAHQPLADAVQRGQIGATVAAEILRLPAEGQVQVEALIDAGGTIDQSAVRALRDDLKAAGVVNPRAKGGGRPRKEQARERVETRVSVSADQWTIDMQGPPQLPVAPMTPVVTVLDRLATTLGTRDTAAVMDVVRFGAAEGWSCAQLVAALEAVGDDATP